MADIVKEISDRAEQALNIADQAVIDQDKLAELKHHLEEIKIQALYTGKGSSITKITICGLISFVVIAVMLKWLLGQGLGTDGMQVLSLITPLIGMLIGSYGVATTVQKVAESKTKVGDMTYKVGDKTYEASKKPKTGTYTGGSSRSGMYSGGGQK